jgi:hypothetical protein
MKERMEEKAYEYLVNSLINHIPKNLNSSYYLADLLGLSRESANRRIRGDIPFTVSEVILLSKTLDISLDDIISPNNANQSSDEQFSSSIYQLSNLMFLSGENQIILAINSFHPILLAHFDLLFKFLYYKWTNLVSNKAPLTGFSDIVLPSNILQIQKQTRKGLEHIHKTMLILDGNVFLHLVKDIQYHYLKKLITQEEKERLKEEMFRLVDLYQQISKTEYLGANTVSIYISVYLPVTSNIGLIQTENGYLSIHRRNDIRYSVINNPNTCDLLKAEFDFLKNQSVNITQSNEIMQLEFFEQQRKHIETL